MDPSSQAASSVQFWGVDQSHPLLGVGLKSTWDGLNDRNAIGSNEPSVLLPSPLAGQHLDASWFTSNSASPWLPQPVPAKSTGSAGSRDLYLITISDGETADLADRLERTGAALVRVSSDERLATLAGRLLDQYGTGTFDRLQVLSHGADDSLRIGATTLSSRNVGHHRQALAQLGSLLNKQGDLLLYGCDLASTEAGDRLVHRLAQLTGADVAASSNDTFADALTHRYDWTLEDSVGIITAGYNDLLTGLGWTGQLGGSASFADGKLSIGNASGTLEIKGNLDASNNGDVIISGGVNQTLTVRNLSSIEISGTDYTVKIGRAHV